MSLDSSPKLNGNMKREPETITDVEAESGYRIFTAEKFLSVNNGDEI